MKWTFCLTTGARPSKRPTPPACASAFSCSIAHKPLAIQSKQYRRPLSLCALFLFFIACLSSKFQVNPFPTSTIARMDSPWTLLLESLKKKALLKDAPYRPQLAFLPLDSKRGTRHVHPQKPSKRYEGERRKKLQVKYENRNNQRSRRKLEWTRSRDDYVSLKISQKSGKLITESLRTRHLFPPVRNTEIKFLLEKYPPGNQIPASCSIPEWIHRSVPPSRFLFRIDCFWMIEMVWY